MNFEIDKIDRQLRNIKAENNLLRQEILKNTSLLEIQKKAEALGFTENKNYIFINEN